MNTVSECCGDWALRTLPVTYLVVVNPLLLIVNLTGSVAVLVDLIEWAPVAA